jgi:acid phosphatase
MLVLRPPGDNMHKLPIHTGIALAILVLSTHSAFAKEPKNLQITKNNLIKYHDSGEYQKDQSKVIDQAMLYLKNRLATEEKKQSQKKLAVVLDIDETALSNYPDMLLMGFGGTYQQIIAAEGNGTDPVIPATLELYRYAKANKIAVFFVTGRTESSRDATIKNLDHAGFKEWDGITFKSENYHEKSVVPYKQGARKDIEKQGYTIILNIGDQESDLMGQHADKTFKLPNPYYFIP